MPIDLLTHILTTSVKTRNVDSSKNAKAEKLTPFTRSPINSTYTRQKLLKQVKKHMN